ncbi:MULTISPECIES: DUF4878 domain-containing protein [Comamonas]|uniref:DUF4878 domain-containing protein n=1 Tax=Comamonas TaxID=283 RepID=UPI00050DB5E2|nr:MULTISPECIES: DUF4878 domain-containing protein [Comamonas]KGG96046.1 hypothetical protein P369_02445 [Comamonas thiooxydans]KGH02430.1 hypothetical protein P367_02450 [Comamonas thiooxydans]KGH09699.1 hypothetical protein P365_02460 [Comamonas thiooxydans]KGH16150.1 hypothetical protein P368_02460 [Comamonas thiooxydans]TZG10172.1 DUF4878 domain-containing protein [Comamonas thiooxydans]
MSASVSLSRRRCLLLPFSLALGLSACATTTPEQSQDELIQRFYALVAAGDFDACIALVSARNISREQLASFEYKLRRMLAGSKGMIDSKGGLAKVEVVERTLSEDVVKLRVLVSYRDGSTRRERINLFQEQGVWKVQL